MSLMSNEERAVIEKWSLKHRRGHRYAQALLQDIAILRGEIGHEKYRADAAQKREVKLHDQLNELVAKGIAQDRATGNTVSSETKLVVPGWPSA